MRLLALLCVLLCGCQSESSVEKELSTKPFAGTVSAKTLHSEYEANQVSADAKYKDKMVILTGVVDTIGKDIGDTPYITLKTSEHSAGVQCMFSEDHNSALSALKKGDSVELHGQVSSYLMNVIVRGCSLR